MSALFLPGCTVHPIKGNLQTKDSKPLMFSSDGNQLLLSPGELSADIGSKPDTSGHIRLKNKLGEISIKTTPEDFQYNHFLIPRDKAKLSSDVKGVWRETTADVYTTVEFESCTGPGTCPQTVSYGACPSGTYEAGTKDYSKHKKSETCRDYSETKLRYSYNCPGSQQVEKSYQNYTVSLELEFLSPDNRDDKLASYQGSSAPLRRVVHRRELSPCITR